MDALSSLLAAAGFGAGSLPGCLAFVNGSAVVVRTGLGVMVVGVVVVAIYEAIVLLTTERSKRLGARKYWLFGTNLLICLALYLLRGLASAAREAISAQLNSLIPNPDWGSFLDGLYFTVIALLVLVLLIQIIGEMYWFNEKQLRLWGKRVVSKEHGTLREHLQVSLSLLNRMFRVVAITVLVVVFFYQLFHRFKATRGTMLSIEAYLEKPAAAVGASILNYLPNLGYLLVIVALGWVSLVFARHFFHSLSTGRLVIHGFQKDWAITTYKLYRSLFLLFLLMISYPYLPGASSVFFKGFSVFAGALLTFGSAGAINNLVSGIVLTYTSALHAGDMVRIGDVTGIVVEKTLLVTRILTEQNEEVSFPNSSVLANNITNFTVRAASGRLGLAVNAGIGYDVDWRRVHALMIEGARKTEHILADPPPIVLESDLGNYAVDYKLIAWTDRPERMIFTRSELRRNVLDCFNAAGVEIMTPSVFAHRDASEAAIPPERIQQPAAPKRIAVDVRNASQDITHSKAREF